MKFTEGAFKDWGYELAREEFGGELIDGGPWLKIKNPNTGKEIVVKDVIADAFLQQILLRPAEYDVIACMNLNGDYISDAPAARLAASVSHRAPTSAPTARCSKRLTAPRRSTPAVTK